MHTTQRSDRPPQLAKVLPFILVLAVAVVALASALGGGSTVEVTVPSGTQFVASLDRTVSTESSEVGDRIELRTTEPLRLDGGQELSAGAVIRGEVTHARGGGRVAGAPELTLRFTEIEVDGESYPVDFAPFRLRGQSDAGESAAMIAGGAVAGGVIGGVVGGSDDVLKGAAAGAVIGTGAAIATDGDDLVLPVGTKLRLRTTVPVTVHVAASADSE